MSRRLSAASAASMLAAILLSNGSALAGRLDTLAISAPADITAAATVVCGQTYCAQVNYSFTVTGGVPPYNQNCNLPSGLFTVGSPTRQLHGQRLHRELDTTRLVHSHSHRRRPARPNRRPQRPSAFRRQLISRRPRPSSAARPLLCSGQLLVCGDRRRPALQPELQPALWLVHRRVTYGQLHGQRLHRELDTTRLVHSHSHRRRPTGPTSAAPSVPQHFGAS